MGLEQFDAGPGHGHNLRVYEIVRLRFWRQRVVVAMDPQGKTAEFPLSPPEFMCTYTIAVMSRSQIQPFVAQFLQANKGMGLYAWYWKPEFMGTKQMHTVEEADRPNNPNGRDATA